MSTTFGRTGSFQDVDLAVSRPPCDLCRTPQPNEILVVVCKCPECSETLVHPACLTRYVSVAQRACVNDCECANIKVQSRRNSSDSPQGSLINLNHTPRQNMRAFKSTPAAPAIALDPPSSSDSFHSFARPRNHAKGGRTSPVSIKQQGLDLHTARPPTYVSTDADKTHNDSGGDEPEVRAHATYTARSRGFVRSTARKIPNRSKSSSPHGSPPSPRKLPPSKSMSAIALSDMAKAGSQQQPARLGQYYSMSDVNSKELTPRAALSKLRGRRSSGMEQTHSWCEGQSLPGSVPGTPHGQPLHNAVAGQSPADTRASLASLRRSQTAPRVGSLDALPVTHSGLGAVHEEGRTSPTPQLQRSMRGLAISTSSGLPISGHRRRGSSMTLQKALAGLTVSELQEELRCRESELERQSDELVFELQRQDTLRKDADALQIRAHQLCVETLKTQDAQKLTKTGKSK